MATALNRVGNFPFLHNSLTNKELRAVSIHQGICLYSIHFNRHCIFGEQKRPPPNKLFEVRTYRKISTAEKLRSYRGGVLLQQPTNVKTSRRESRSSSLSQSSFSSPTTPCYYSPPQAYAAGHVQPAQFRTPSPPSPRRHIRTPSPPSPMSTPSPRHYRREHASPRVLFPSPSPPQMFSSPSSQSSYSSSWPSSPSQSPDSTYPSPPRHGRPNVCRTPGEATPPPSPPPPRRCPRAPQRSPETTPPSRGYADRRSPGNPPRRRYAPRRLPFSDQCDSPDSTTAPLPPRQVAYREPPGEAMARPTNPNFIRRVVSLRRRLQIMHRNLPRH
ncbi:hypothetical protein J6590_081061 [Homalodisca vitripennis]|nr:hypothetical protein J6590_081061 [Homalodisca vitripennis]